EQAQAPAAAQTPAEPKAKAEQSKSSSLPQIEVGAKRIRVAKRKPAGKAKVVAPPPTPQRPEPSTPAGDVPSDRAGTVGYLGTQTSTATKTKTALINVPQSVSVFTKEFIRDQNFQNFTDLLRYSPGVIPHQGEGNRDQVVIRGQSSSADFFINGIRDDVQYFR